MLFSSFVGEAAMSYLMSKSLRLMMMLYLPLSLFQYAIYLFGKLEILENDSCMSSLESLLSPSDLIDSEGFLLRNSAMQRSLKQGKVFETLQSASVLYSATYFQAKFG